MPNASLGLDCRLDAIDGPPEVVVSSPPELIDELCVLHHSHRGLDEVKLIFLARFRLVSQRGWMRIVYEEPKDSHVFVEERPSVLTLTTCSVFIGSHIDLPIARLFCV